VRRIISDAEHENIAILTFNYDVSLEYALYFNGIQADYCLDEQKPGSLKVLKLHGSLNWFRCGGCKRIAPITMEMLKKQSMFSKLRAISESQFILPIGPYVSQLYHCQGKQGVLDGPVVVPPTSNKLNHHSELQSVWAAAAAALSEAENVLVFGYSLPLSDHFFRYLYALGSVGDARPKRFWVFDPDPTVEERFRDLLGPETADRFAMHVRTLSSALQYNPENWQETVFKSRS